MVKRTFFPVIKLTDVVWALHVASVVVADEAPVVLADEAFVYILYGHLQSNRVRLFLLFFIKKVYSPRTTDHELDYDGSLPGSWFSGFFLFLLHVEAFRGESDFRLHFAET